MDENFNFNAPLSPMRFQSQLGKEVKRMYKEGNNVVKLSLARVIKVNYKYNTVDVMTTRHKNTTTKNPTDNGRYSARLPVQFGGRTPQGKPYGSNTLVTVGSLVLIGFLEGNKDYPIVLNVYGDADNQSQLTRTTMTSADESDEDVQRELWQLFNLYPSMTYHNIDGRGNQEITFSGKSFMLITDTDPENDYIQDEGFEYEHLPSSRFANGEQIEPISPNSPTLLYVHQGVYDNHRVTLFIKSDGTFRMGSKHIDREGITYQQMNTDGSYSIVQKIGTNDPEAETATASKFEIDRDGNIILKTPENRFEITKMGVFVNGRPIAASIDLDGNKVIEDLKTGLKDVTTSIEVINGKIETKVSRTEYSIDLESVRKYAEELTSGVQTEMDDITKALSDLDTYIDGAFLDGVIESTESKAIEKYLNNLVKEKADIDTKYSEVYSNTYLPEENQSELAAAKGSYDTRHQELINTIEVAVTDGRSTVAEKEAVDLAFTNYTTALTELTRQFETAINAIATAKAKEAERNAVGYVDGEIKTVTSTITQLADQISSKVESETFTTTTQQFEIRFQNNEDRLGTVEQEVDEVARQVPYKTELISTNGLVFKNGYIDTTIFCRVYKGTEDVTNTLPANAFVWTRVSNDAEGDAVWNAAHVGIGKSIQVDQDDVPVRATFMCDVTIDEEENETPTP